MADRDRYVFGFGGGDAQGDASMRDLLGGKGANLAEMARIGLPVPAGFTVSTAACVYAMANGGRMPEGLEEMVDEALTRVEALTGAALGGRDRPLLLSVRSGARVSMPGMMDTVLDIGLNDEVVEALAGYAGSERFAWDCYRRYLQMYGNVALGVDSDLLEAVVRQVKSQRGARTDADLDADAWRRITADLKGIIKARCAGPLPEDPRAQLHAAIAAVFRSWNSPRAIAYRRIHAIPDDWGTAANVMAMVFGNLGEDSGTGVAFTRNPATGAPGVYGEYLIDAQGEDVVAGTRTPGPLDEANRRPGNDVPSLERLMPARYRELVSVLETLERHYGDVQDVEFTLERGRLWILQTRLGQRTGRAAVRIALDLLDEGIIADVPTALARVDAGTHVPQLLHPTIDPSLRLPAPLVTGLAASPGAASGRAVFDPDEAERRGAANECIVLVRRETSADDIHGMHASKGLLTATGGLTSHAAVVARSLGVPCIVGAGEIDLLDSGEGFTVGDRKVSAGEWITLDGTSGTAYEGRLPTVRPAVSGEFGRLMELADRHRRLGVLANADTPQDARHARELGAGGIGLCRTEHMFFAPQERLDAMRAVILADDDAERDRALESLVPHQRADFEALFREMDGLPVTIRLLDPPLHEFLPADAGDIEALAGRLGKPGAEVAERVGRMRERNPMLGFRGCRIGVLHESVYRMQVRAIAQAAIALVRDGRMPRPEIMVPLVAIPEELAYIRRYTVETLERLKGEAGVDFPCPVGTMIELPRAALAAAAIARYADFFSFGTNDLTQTAFGLSRDDAERFLPAYREHHLLADDPFVSLDVDGVGELVRIAIERGRATRPDLVLGICGEHGGDPASIAFCEAAGLDYVSCSPYRVPVARLAAAQATF